MAGSQTDKMRKLFADKQLDASEMDAVAGGTTHEIADDSRFLNVLLRGRPGQCDRYGETKVSYGSGSTLRRAEVARAWDSIGVKMLTKKGDDDANRYWLADGTPLTRDQAWAYAQQVVGKTLKKSDWYWEN